MKLNVKLMISFLILTIITAGLSIINIMEVNIISDKVKTEHINLNLTTIQVVTYIALFLSIVMAFALYIINFQPLKKRFDMMKQKISNINKGLEVDEVVISYTGIEKSLFDELNILIKNHNIQLTYLQSVSEGNTDEIEVVESTSIVVKHIQENIQSISRIKNELIRIEEEHRNGNIDKRLDDFGNDNMFGDITRRVNNLLDYHLNITKEITDVVSSYSSGNFAPIMYNLPGKQRFITDSIDLLRNSLRRINKEVRLLVTKTLKGNFKARGKTTRLKGGFKEIVDGINYQIDAITSPINESIGVIKKMSERDFSSKVLGDYKGEHAILKNATNETIVSINDSLNIVKRATEELARGADQISSSSQSLSQGTTEQASAIEEISSAITEVDGQTSNNLEMIMKASDISNKTVEIGNEGQSNVRELIESMDQINDSSDNIKKITKIIDDIAFQINLLALNASVEAARSGKYGKGFAVVAEEVRNLAVKSAETVKDTSNIIEQNIKNIEKGNQLVNNTIKLFDDISNGAVESADMFAKIVNASKEQASSLKEINSSLEQINTVTQGNTSNAEETASASEELNSMAQKLKELVNTFKLMILNN